MWRGGARADLDTMRSWLGHIGIKTSSIYAGIDLEMKARAMAICDAVEGGVMAFLRPLGMQKRNVAENPA